MWTHYRKWKSWLIGALMVFAYFLIQSEVEGSSRWKAGIIIAALLGIAYIIEEVVWMAKRHGRPCGHCGQKVQMKSFRVLTTCPHCGQPLE